MKVIMIVLVAALAGCATSVPMHSFSPFTTSEGQEKWRMVYQALDEATVQALLESEIGRNRICGKGWEIVSRSQVKGFDMIEGQCKK